MRLAVLNPGGNDREQIFEEFAGPVDDRIHAPVNYHGFAACTAGSFHRKISTIPSAQKEVLLLIRWDLPLCLKTLKRLKAAGKIVAVSLKESGLFQFAELFEPARRIPLFREVCALADGCLSTTPELVPIYQSAGARRVEFIPTPYPVGDDRWDFSRPLPERDGIFIGTREFEIATRNHLAALLIACGFGKKVTVINVEDRPGRKRLAALGYDKLQVIEGPVPYSEYLRLMARRRVVMQLDRSAVPGQVAGDALLCGMPCIGGDGVIERLAFEDLYGGDGGQVRARVERLLRSDEAWEQAVTASRAAAQRSLSFPVIAERLAAFFKTLR